MTHTDSIVEHGIASMGQYYEKHQVAPGKYFIRTTRDSGRFTTWMNWDRINMEAEKEIKPVIDRQRGILISIYEQIAKSCHGHFNAELYLKIIKAKRNNGTIFW